MAISGLELKDLSVLVTCYNKKASLNGFTSQARELSALGCEIVIVDDGSTDGSTEILEEICREITNCVLIKQTNQGSAAARNKAVEASKRKFLQFLDIDDFLNVNLLKFIFEQKILDDKAISIFEICRVSKPHFPDITAQLSRRKIDQNEVKALLSKSLGYSRIIYPRSLIESEKLKFSPTFESLGGERFILDDFFWLIHLASIEIDAWVYDNSVIYGYFKPENPDDADGGDFSRQAKLFPSAISIVIDGLKNCDHSHDSTFVNESMLNSLEFHLKYVSTRNLLSVTMEILSVKTTLTYQQNALKTLLTKIDLAITCLKILNKNLIRPSVNRFLFSRKVVEYLRKK